MSTLTRILFLLMMVVGFVAVGQFRPGSGSGSGGGATGPAQLIAYVATNGNNGTAVVGDPLKPYQTVKAALEATGSGVLVYVYPGTYTVTPQAGVSAPETYDSSGATVPAIKNKTDVVVRGYGATLYGAGQGSLFFIQSSTNILIEGLTFAGNWPTTNAALATPLYAHCYLLQTNRNIKFKDVTVRDYGNHGIAAPLQNSARNNELISIESSRFLRGGATNQAYVDGSAVAIPARGLRVANSYFEELMRGVELEGIQTSGELTQGEWIVIGNHFYRVWENAVQLLATVNSGTENFQSVIVADNYFEDCGVNFAHTGGAVTQLHPIFCTQGSFVTIANNIIKGGVSTAIRFDAIGTNRVTDINIIGNQIYRTRLVGISVGNTVGPCENVNVRGNIVKDAGGYGVEVGGKNHIVSENQFIGCGTNSTYSGAGIIRVADFGGGGSTNILVKDNYVGDSVLGANNHNIAVSVATSVGLVDVINTRLGPRLAILNNAIRHLSSGTIEHTSFVTTTDATTTTVFDYTTLTDSTVLFDVESVSGNVSDNGQGVSRRMYGYRNVGGTVSALALNPQSTLHESSSSVFGGVSASVSGTTIRHRVDGVVGATLNWRNRTRITIVK